MKAKILILTVLSAVTFFLPAQEYIQEVGYAKRGYETNFKKNKANENWFISVGAGGSMLMGDYNDLADTKDRITLNPTLAIGKWFKPYWGIRAAFTGGALHGFHTNPHHGRTDMEHHTYVAGSFNFLYDVTNHWGVYSDKRVFRFIPFVGLGYAKRFKNEDQNRDAADSYTVNIGALASFRLSEHVDFHIEYQAMLLEENFNGIEKGKRDGLMQLSAGLTFKLGKTYFEAIDPVGYESRRVINDRVNEIRTDAVPVQTPVPVTQPATEAAPAVSPGQVPIINQYGGSINIYTNEKQEVE